MKKEIAALIDDINADIGLYCSQFSQEHLNENERKNTLSRINGKKCALEIITKKKYEIVGEQIKEVK